MSSLPVLTPLPDDQVSSPTDLHRCEHYACVQMVRRCVERQFAVNGRRSGFAMLAGERGYAKDAHCAQECEQGRRLAERFPDLARGKKRPVQQPVKLHGFDLPWPGEGADADGRRNTCKGCGGPITKRSIHRRDAHCAACRRERARG